MHKIHARIISCIAAACLMVGTTGLASAAQPEKPPVLTESEVKVFTDFLTEFDVSPEVQDSLVAKVQSGHPIDSMNSEAKPVSTENIAKNGEEIEIRRFADGSILTTSNEVPADLKSNKKNSTITPYATRSGCEESKSGTTRYWDNCKFEARSGLLALSFYADVTIKRGAGVYDSIRRVYTGSYWLPASCGASQNLKILRKQENSAGPARARYSVTATACIIVTTNNYWVEARVGKDGATATQKLD